MKYRARGVYKPTHRESWITTVWRKTEEEAKEDVELFGHNYVECWIVASEI